MIKIKSVLIAASLIMGLALPATAQIGEPRQNFSVGFNGGVNLNSASFTPKIKQNSLMGITGGLTARYISEKYFTMICGAQVELNISQRGWDELFEIMDANGQTVEDPTRSYTRKMTYIDIPFLAHLAFGKERGLQFFVNAGPQIGLLIGAWKRIRSLIVNISPFNRRFVRFPFASKSPRSKISARPSPYSVRSVLMVILSFMRDPSEWDSSAFAFFSSPNIPPE